MVANRAAILPTPGDPFLLTYWYKMFNKVWRDEVDKLYIHVNGQTDKEVLRYFRNLFEKDDKVVYIESIGMVDHGNAILKALDECKEKHVMLVEDDGFVFKSGKVKACFNKLEEDYAIVGSKRGSCSQELLDKAQAKWNLDYSGFGDSGCNFWPNFFFTSKQLLKLTDCNFNAVAWKAGDIIGGLNQSAEADCVGDTFVNTSLQLRGLVPDNRIYYEPQYHGATDDEDDYQAKTNIWSPDACWLHVGSLSSGYFGLLDIEKDLPSGVFETTQEKMELERRIVFWLIFSNAWENEELLKDQHNDYKEAIRQLVHCYDLDASRIARRKAQYKEVLK